MSPIERRREKAQGSLSGPFGLGGAGLGAIIGAFAGNPLAGAQIGQQTGSLIGGLARPGNSPSAADKVNSIGGAGLGLAGQAQGAGMFDGGSAPSGPRVDYNPELQQQGVFARRMQRGFGRYA